MMGGGDVPGDTSGDTQPGGPMRPDAAGVYYGQDEEAGTMASPGPIEATVGEGTGATGSEGFSELGPEPVPTALQNLKAFFYAWDHLGTTRLVSNSDRSVMERHDYEPFGVELRPIQNLTGNTHQYTGHERDLASGLDYMHARYYVGSLGRFMRPDNGVDQDPMIPQSWNLYAYVRGNPVNASDPTGHWKTPFHRLMIALPMRVAGFQIKDASRAARGNADVDLNPSTQPLSAAVQGNRRVLSDDHGFHREGESPQQARDRIVRDNQTAPNMDVFQFGGNGHRREDRFPHSPYGDVGGHGTVRDADNPQVHRQEAMQALGDAMDQVNNLSTGHHISDDQAGLIGALFSLHLGGHVNLSEECGRITVTQVGNDRASFCKAVNLLRKLLPKARESSTQNGISR